MFLWVFKFIKLTRRHGRNQACISGICLLRWYGPRQDSEIHTSRFDHVIALRIADGMARSHYVRDKIEAPESFAAEK